MRKLSGCDRLLLLVIAVWTAAGVPLNYLQVHGLLHVPVWVTAMVLWGGMPVVAAWSIFRQGRRPADYGISFGRGGVVSLGVVALIHVYLAINGKLTIQPQEYFAWSACGAFVEEVGFRAVLIDRLILLMDGVRNKVWWAIAASSALWTVPHLVSKSLEQAIGGIFLGGLVFGYVYYKSRSILLTAWIHGVANAGYAGGLLIAAVYCVIGAAGWGRGARRPRAEGFEIISG